MNCILMASVKTITEVASAQQHYEDIHKAQDLTRKDVEEALYNPNAGIAEAIRKLAEARSFRKNTTNEIIQVAVLGSGVVLFSKILKFTKSSTINQVFRSLKDH